MKGEKTKIILELLLEKSLETGDWWLAFLTTPKSGAAPYFIEQKVRAAKKERDKNRSLNREKERFYKMISYLKKEGFVERKSSDWSLTTRGLDFVKKIRKKFNQKYEIKDENFLKLVTFDIPEKLRKYRDWFRDVLKQLNFRMLHKSVWLGKNKIPEELLNELRELKLVDYIHIVAITKSGSLYDYLNSYSR